MSTRGPWFRLQASLRQIDGRGRAIRIRTSRDCRFRLELLENRRVLSNYVVSYFPAGIRSASSAKAVNKNGRDASGRSGEKRQQ